jgi:chromosome segregation ATPase
MRHALSISLYLPLPLFFQTQHEEAVSKYQGQLKQAKKVIEELEADKAMAVAAAKQELHSTLEAKDEELTKIRERVKQLEAEIDALKQKTHELQTAGLFNIFSREIAVSS